MVGRLRPGSDYAKRFPPELKLELRAVKTEPRGSKTLETLYAAERERIEAAIAKGMRIVALDERGTALTTKALAARLQAWQGEGDDVALVIGGRRPDPAFKAAAHERIRLSDLTLPHAMARCCWWSSCIAHGRSTPGIPITANEQFRLHLPFAKSTSRAIAGAARRSTRTAAGRARRGRRGAGGRAAAESPTAYVQRVTALKLDAAVARHDGWACLQRPSFAPTPPSRLAAPSLASQRMSAMPSGC